MSWLWLALVGGPPAAEGLRAVASLREAGRPVGHIAAWDAAGTPPVRAVKVDARAVDPEGAAGRVSLVLLPWRLRLPFDDLAVQQARRAVLSGPRRRLVSTFVRGDSIFAGAITALPDDEPAGLVDDPFARIAPPRALVVGEGFLASMPAPAGPVIERYGGGRPWPWDRFPHAGSS